MTSRGLLLPIVLAACTPAPANSQQILQTVQEMVDQSRAIAVEDDAVNLAANVDPDGDPAALRDEVMAAIAAAVPCATATPGLTDAGLQVVFAEGCTVHGRGLAGGLAVTFARPVGDLVVTLTLQAMTRGPATLSGSTQVSWAVDGTQRVVGELRLDLAGPDPETPARQVEVLTDRFQRTYKGMRQVDGWLRWQTKPGKWSAEIEGWELAPGTALPVRGFTVVDTPYEHDVILDHRDLGEGTIELRANGGRADRVYTVAADGTITDLGED